MRLGDSYSDAYVQGGDWQETQGDWSYGIHVQGGTFDEVQQAAGAVVTAAKRTVSKVVGTVADELPGPLADAGDSPLPWLIGLAAIGGVAVIAIVLTRSKKR